MEEEEPTVFLSSGVVTLTKKINGKTVHSPGSNFWVPDDGQHVEGLFQADKHEGHPWRVVVLRSKEISPNTAKKLGRGWELSRDELFAWDRRKWYTMRHLISDKLYYPEFCMWLAATGSRKIKEINWWHDNQWGSCQCIKCHQSGNNHLGEILMKQRELLMENDDNIMKRIRKMYGLEAVREKAVA